MLCFAKLCLLLGKIIAASISLLALHIQSRNSSVASEHYQPPPCCHHPEWQEPVSRCYIISLQACSNMALYVMITCISPSLHLAIFQKIDVLGWDKEPIVDPGQNKNNLYCVFYHMCYRPQLLGLVQVSDPTRHAQGCGQS